MRICGTTRFDLIYKYSLSTLPNYCIFSDTLCIPIDLFGACVPWHLEGLVTFQTANGPCHFVVGLDGRFGKLGHCLKLIPGFLVSSPLA